MTKEEIIHRLQYARHRIDNVTYAPDVLKAIDIAIEAVGNTDADTISRQAAISAICSACGKIDCDKMDKCERLQLPPANTSEIPNSSDTISRQAAIDGKICIRRSNGVEIYDDYVVPVEYLEQLPPAQPAPSQVAKDIARIVENGQDMMVIAQPEIIRCRNCKFASGDSRICMKFGHSPIGELDFCAWAERRNDE